MPSVTVKEGYLHKYKAEGPQLLSRFAFKKRYFWLTSETLSYAKTPDWQVGIYRIGSSSLTKVGLQLTHTDDDDDNNNHNNNFIMT